MPQRNKMMWDLTNQKKHSNSNNNSRNKRSQHLVLIMQILKIRKTWMMRKMREMARAKASKRRRKRKRRIKIRAVAQQDVMSENKTILRSDYLEVGVLVHGSKLTRQAFQLVNSLSMEVSQLVKFLNIH